MRLFLAGATSSADLTSWTVIVVIGHDAMSELKPHRPQPRAGLPVAAGLSDQARAFQRAGKAKSTQRAYLSDAGLFAAWCAQHEDASSPVR
jgi:hypothetical protein